MPYLYGIDLYNYAYWWECHETLEGLWISGGRSTRHAQFVQGLIQVAAANLHWHRKNLVSARSLAIKGTGRLQSAAAGVPVYMGIRVSQFVGELEKFFEAQAERPVLIELVEIG